MDLTEERTCPGCNRKCRWWSVKVGANKAKHWCHHCRAEAEWKPLPGQQVMDFGTDTREAQHD